jgi:hypothetical protein
VDVPAPSNSANANGVRSVGYGESVRNTPQAAVPNHRQIDDRPSGRSATRRIPPSEEVQCRLLGDRLELDFVDICFALLFGELTVSLGVWRLRAEAHQEWSPFVSPSRRERWRNTPAA